MPSLSLSFSPHSVSFTYTPTTTSSLSFEFPLPLCQTPHEAATAKGQHQLSALSQQLTRGSCRDADRCSGCSCHIHIFHFHLAFPFASCSSYSSSLGLTLQIQFVLHSLARSNIFCGFRIILLAATTANRINSFPAPLSLMVSAPQCIFVGADTPLSAAICQSQRQSQSERPSERSLCQRALMFCICNRAHNQPRDPKGCLSLCVCV